MRTIYYRVLKYDPARQRDMVADVTTSHAEARERARELNERALREQGPPARAQFAVYYAETKESGGRT